jgi:hypothetical protein
MGPKALKVSTSQGLKPSTFWGCWRHDSSRALTLLSLFECLFEVLRYSIAQPSSGIMNESNDQLES